MLRFPTGTLFHALLLGVALVVGPSCSVNYASDFDTPAARNECSSSSDCGDGYCAQGQCRAYQTQVKTVLIEVTPPSSSMDVAGSRLLLPAVALPSDGGRLDLQLPKIAKVSATLKIKTAGDCVPKFAPLKNGSIPVRAPDESLPFKLTLTPSERMLGVATETYTAEAITPVRGTLSATLDVPTGLYDILIEPSDQPEITDCWVAPTMLPKYRIEDNVALDLSLAQPVQSELTLEWRGGSDSLSEWTADILDAASGRVISSRTQLGRPTTYSNYLKYTFRLAQFAPDGRSVDELVRLSPPKGTSAPILLTVRSGLGISLNEESTRLYPINSLPAAVLVAGSVFEAGSTRGRASTVTLVATQLEDITEGVFASFSRTVTTDEEGRFQEYLLPGSYRVYAVPRGGSDLAATEERWEVARTPEFQGGKAIQLARPVAITGRAFASGLQPAVGAAVQTTASVAALDRWLSYAPDAGGGWALRQALGDVPFVPRASTNAVESSGQFTVLADPGVFDISVRPNQSTGFAWHVQPNVTARDSQTQLGQLSLPLPIVYRGAVAWVARSNEGDEIKNRVPGAQIRAFIYLTHTTVSKDATTVSLTSDPTQANSVVQIADTRADESGNFELLIPAKLNLN